MENRLEAYKTAILKDNSIMQLFLDKVTKEQQTIIQERIDSNKALLAGEPIKKRPNAKRPKKAPAERKEHFIEVDRIKEDLLSYGLYTKEEIQTKKLYSLINQLRNFRETNSTFYYHVLEKISSWLKKNTAYNKESYIIGAFNKELKEAGRA